MWLFPLAAAGVSGYFAGVLALQWHARHRPHHLAWSVALVMFGLASACAGLGLLVGWSPGLYRVYYLFGAILNVPVLALGTMYLLARRPVAHVCGLVVVIAGIAAIASVSTASVMARGLDTSGIPRGSEVLPSGVRMLSRYYSILGYVVVVGGAVWSALRLLRGREGGLKRLAEANLLIAAGTTVVAAGSEVARVGTGSTQGLAFAVGLFLGVSLMFLGFLRSRSRPSPGEARA
jgi:hypothetical protein